ncbi:hypothetical protein BUALT_Bualt12G0067200 [Buddleja alternifolia]|uniref:Uncharacterized protein n=1 Tax=Buddleja alternifolia TaxID=168488 RepID=A0AAV6WVG3_9LAMI|nr:hypothetical protein BUALT_Bualt12G0067200 [Buddleja alternifolia]
MNNQILRDLMNNLHLMYMHKLFKDTKTLQQWLSQPPKESKHYEALRRAHVPTFDGDHDLEGVQKWFKERDDNLGKYALTIMGSPQLKIHRFTKVLKGRIQSALAVFEARNFDELLGAAIRAKVDIKIRDKENKLKRPRTAMNPGQDGECRWKTQAYIRCGLVGHKVTQCKVPEDELTKLFVPRTNDQRQNGNARVFSMTEQEADNAEDVVIGTLLINNLLAFVLITNLIHKDCTIEIENIKLNVNLVQLNIGDFDVILGMDWLARNFPHVDCRAKKIDFCPSGKESFSYQGDVRMRSKKANTLLSATQAIRAIQKGCEAYLALITYDGER